MYNFKFLNRCVAVLLQYKVNNLTQVTHQMVLQSYLLSQW